MRYIQENLIHAFFCHGSFRVKLVLCVLAELSSVLLHSRRIERPSRFKFRAPVDKIERGFCREPDTQAHKDKMPQHSTSAANSKKNLGGGKGHKRAARGGGKKSGKNFDFCQDFVDDIMNGEDVSPLTVARVERLSGQGRMELLTVNGKTLKAALKGNLRCKKGAARSDDNPIAAMVGGFVILQEADYGSMVMGVLSRSNVATLKEYFDEAPASYFETSQQGGDGFDWDFAEAEEPATTGETTATVTVADVDIDRL